jgi:hypothetical protein
MSRFHTNLCSALCDYLGCGKSAMAKMLKDEEIRCGGQAVRILSLDDYFMAVRLGDTRCGVRVRYFRVSCVLYLSAVHFQYLMRESAPL